MGRKVDFGFKKLNSIKVPKDFDLTGHKTLGTRVL